jgi:hypothetical protein
MAMKVALTELVRSSQQLANRVATQAGAIADSQIDPAEWKQRVSAMYGRLHETVVPTGARCFEVEVDLDPSTLQLPDDHYMSIGVDVVRGGGWRCELDEVMIEERNELTRPNASEALGWAMIGNSLRLYPSTTRGVYKHIYVPQPTDLSTASDLTIVDVLTQSGRDLIEWGTAAIALHRDDSNQTRAVAERDAAATRLLSWAVQRSLTQPKRQRVHELRALYGRRRGWRGC